jgi:hypothetical protein
MPTEQHLLPALAEALDWMRNAPAPILDPEGIPPDVNAVLAVLNSQAMSAFPPRIGSPLHPAGPYTLVDLAGASHLLLESLVRPLEGAGANFWSGQFEIDVQHLVDGTPWRPTGALRQLIGRTVRRADGTHITDIDAVAARNRDLLLISCKSVASTSDLVRGSHAAVRNFREKAERAVAEWDAKVTGLREDPERLGLSRGEWDISGIVVFPTVPYVVDEAARRPRPPLHLPPAVVTSELEDALRRRR